MIFSSILNIISDLISPRWFELTIPHIGDYRLVGVVRFGLQSDRQKALFRFDWSYCSFYYVFAIVIHRIWIFLTSRIPWLQLLITTCAVRTHCCGVSAHACRSWTFMTPSTEMSFLTCSKLSPDGEPSMMNLIKSLNHRIIVLESKRRTNLTTEVVVISVMIENMKVQIGSTILYSGLM